VSTASRVRHSPVGWLARRAIHYAYRLQHPGDRPVQYKLAEHVDVRLHPEGEIAEFMAFPSLFEKVDFELVATYLKSGMRVLDIGANIGAYSILADKSVGPEGTVWAFEPSTESYRRMLKNLHLNACHGVHPLQVALSDQADTFLELKADRGFGDAYRYLSTGPSGDGVGEEVPVTTLDSFASKNSVARVDFMKVDVEGGEYRIFRGAQQLLRDSHNVVVMFESDPEWCERAGCKTEDSFNLFRSLGFGLYCWRGAHGWSDGERDLANAGMVWATRDRQRLPKNS
jgi:FkbM family methyltransferase